MNISIQWTNISVGLIGLGIVLLVIAYLVRSKRKQTPAAGKHFSANNGGVVIGGDSHGIVNTGSINSTIAPAGASIWEKMGTFAGVLSLLLGIYLAVFPSTVPGA